MLHRAHERNILTVVAGVALAIAFGACTPATTLETAWTTVPTAGHAPPMTRVVTVFVSTSAAVARTAEDKLAHDLAVNGVQATPAYAVLSEQESRALYNIGHGAVAEAGEVKDRLRSMGYDGVVVMRIIDRTQNVNYSGGWDYWGYGSYWGYPYYSPGFTYTYETYRMSADAYSLKTDQLVWSGLIRSEDPDSARKMIGSSTQIVSQQLTKHGLAG